MLVCVLYLLVTNDAPVEHLRHQLVADSIQQEHRAAAETHRRRRGLEG